MHCWQLWNTPARSSRALRRSHTRPFNASASSASDTSSEFDDKLFASCSPAARMWVYQFIFDLKLRTFGSALALEQEVRKSAPDRVYMKLLDPVAPRGPPQALWRRTLHYVDGTMPAFTQWAKRRWFPWLFLLDALLRGAGQVMICEPRTAKRFRVVFFVCRCCLWSDKCAI